MTRTLFLAGLMLILSCKKGDNTTTPLSEKAKLVSGKNWIYTEYFSSYTQPSASLMYKRDKTQNNKNDLNGAKVMFSTDGTYSEQTSTGTTLTGNWKLIDNDTKIQVQNNTGTYTSTIIDLNGSELIWYDEQRGTYAKMVANTYTPAYSIDISKLTGKSWTYYEYFTQYSSADAKLVFKRERSANALPLTQTTVVFNTNGTFNETGANGQIINGTWIIINGNQLRTVSVAGGTNTATMISLTDNNFIWHNTNADTYAKMVVKQ